MKPQSNFCFNFAAEQLTTDGNGNVNKKFFDESSENKEVEDAYDATSSILIKKNVLIQCGALL